MCPPVIYPPGRMKTACLLWEPFLGCYPRLTPRVNLAVVDKNLQGLKHPFFLREFPVQKKRELWNPGVFTQPGSKAILAGTRISEK